MIFLTSLNNIITKFIALLSTVYAYMYVCIWYKLYIILSSFRWSLSDMHLSSKRRSFAFVHVPRTAYTCPWAPLRAPKRPNVPWTAYTYPWVLLRAPYQPNVEMFLFSYLFLVSHEKSKTHRFYVPITAWPFASIILTCIWLPRFYLQLPPQPRAPHSNHVPIPFLGWDDGDVN